MIIERKAKQYARQIIYTNRRHLFAKFTPDFDLTDERVVQCDVLVVKVLLLMITNDKINK